MHCIATVRNFRSRWPRALVGAGGMHLERCPVGGHRAAEPPQCRHGMADERGLAAHATALGDDYQVALTEDIMNEGTGYIVMPDGKRLNFNYEKLNTMIVRGIKHFTYNLSLGSMPFAISRFYDRRYEHWECGKAP